MFDKTLILSAGRHDSYQRTEVHEHRAPTDASVKLLREMEQAALDKIMATVRLEGCPVDCMLAQMRDPFGDYQFFIRYKLGTVTREVRHDFRPRFNLAPHDLREQAIGELRDALAKDIAIGLLDQPIRQLLGGKFPLFP
jgi:hypothetical protein